MSTTTTIGAEALGHARSPSKGFWRRLFDRMVAARQAQAKREIARYMSTLSEKERKDLGWPT